MSYATRSFSSLVAAMVHSIRYELNRVAMLLTASCLGVIGPAAVVLAGCGDYVQLGNQHTAHSVGFELHMNQNGGLGSRSDSSPASFPETPCFGGGCPRTKATTPSIPFRLVDSKVAIATDRNIQDEAWIAWNREPRQHSFAIIARLCVYRPPR